MANYRSYCYSFLQARIYVALRLKVGAIVTHAMAPTFSSADLGQFKLGLPYFFLRIGIILKFTR